MATTPNITVIVTTEQGPEVGAEIARTTNEPISVLVEFADRTQAWFPAAKVLVAPADPTPMVADVLGMIREDNLGHVATFGDLHDHTDANCYLIDAIAAATENDLELKARLADFDVEIDLANAISTLVDHALPLA